MKTRPSTIADLISLEIKPEERKRRKEKVKILTAPLDCPQDAKPSRKYECDVFNFLLQKQEDLGIQTVYRFANLRVDGAILLVDRRRLAVEIKFRMNWKKALEAESEFRRFLLSSEAKAHPVHGAIVFFEEFQGAGWDKKAKSRFLENGWNHWYASYFNIDGYRADLFRLRQGTVEYYGMALANSLIANVEQMSEEDKEKLMTALNATGTARMP
jgi:hypothetical protein